MTALVQAETATGYGSSPPAATFDALPTTGNSVVVKIGSRGYAGELSSVTDNQGNAYTRICATNANYTGETAAMEVWWCAAIGAPSGTFTVTGNWTVADQPSSFAMWIEEVSGINAVDIYATSGASAVVDTVTLTPSANSSAVDFVTTAICLGLYGATVSYALTQPPGNPVGSAFMSEAYYDYTSLQGAGAGYKVTSSLETSSVEFSWASANAAVAAVALVSFKQVGGTVPLAAAANDTVIASAALAPTAAASDTATASASLTGYAAVVLTAPLWTGANSIVLPQLWSQSHAPVAGDTLYYDPTYTTVYPNGSFVSTSNNYSFIVQFNDGTGNAVAVVMVVPTQAAQAEDMSSATGQLTTSINLAAAANDAVSGLGTLLTKSLLAGAANDLSTASASLTNHVNLSGSAIDNSTGAAILRVSSQLTGTANDVSSATARLKTSINLLAAANDVSSANAGLIANINLVAHALDSASASGGLVVKIPLAGAANDASSGQGVLSVFTPLHAAADSVVTAMANLTTRILMQAAGNDVVTATGLLNAVTVNLVGAGSSASGGLGVLTETGSPAGIYTSDPAYIVYMREENTPLFPELGPTESVVLTFDFSQELINGETLIGILAYRVVVSAGVDPNPTDIIEGIPAYSDTLTQVLIPVSGEAAVVGCDYYIVVTATTTNPQKVLARYGLLQVRS